MNQSKNGFYFVKAMVNLIYHIRLFVYVFFIQANLKGGAHCQRQVAFFFTFSLQGLPRGNQGAERMGKNQNGAMRTLTGKIYKGTGGRENDRK